MRTEREITQRMAKGITDEQREQIRLVLVNEVKPRFAGAGGDKWQTAAAEKIGVAQSTLSRLAMDPPMGGSFDFATKLGAFLNRKPEAILTGKDDEEMPRLRDLPGFVDALARAKTLVAEQRREISNLALERAGDFRGRPAPSSVTSEFLIAVAASAVTERPPQRHGKP